MGNFKEYDHYDGLGLAELVRKKEVSPVELCEEAIRRIERINPRLNAVVTTMYDYALKIVQEPLPDGPFTGVPFLLKDLLSAFEGVPMTGGSKAFRNYIPDHDSEMVKRFKKAGLVILGKTNCPEFGLLGITEPELHGPTRNPWNTAHSTGGSSGGSAAAVASGIVPMASAGDGGGSIRIPSSCCGLFGLKVTRGRNPTGPDYGQIWQGAVVEHILSRSVRDSAAMLDETQGPDVGAPYVIPPPERPFLEETLRDPGTLTIAFTTRSPLDTPVHPECIKAVTNTAKLLEKLGHNVEEAQPNINGRAMANSYFAMYYGEVAADIEELESVLGRKAKPDDVEPETWALALLGRTFSAGYFVRALREWGILSREMGRFHERYDLYLTPTMAVPPYKIGELQPSPVEKFATRLINTLGLGRLLKFSGAFEKIAIQSLSKTPFTQIANLTGQPAMSLPLSWTADNLPCGVQVIGKFGDEATLIRLASQLEKEMPWFDKRPPEIF